MAGLCSRAQLGRLRGCGGGSFTPMSDASFERTVVIVCVASGDSGFLSMAASAGGSSVEPRGECLRGGSASHMAV